MSPNPQILLNFDGWKSSLPDVQRAAVDRQLSIAPDPDAERKKIQNIFFIAAGQGIKPGQVNSIYDQALGAHSLREGWGPLNDTDAFHARAVQEATRMDAENTLLHGKDGDTEEAAKAREASLVARAYWTAAGRAGVEKTAPPKLPASALHFQNWQDEAKANPGYSPKNADRYWKAWDRAYSAGRQDLEIASNVARDVIAKLGDGTEADMSADAFKSIVPRFRGLSPQQRALAFEQLQQQAKDSGLSGGMGTAGKATVALQRAITNMEANISDLPLPFGARSDGAQWKEGDKVGARLYNQIVDRFGGDKMPAGSAEMRPVPKDMADFLNAKAQEGYADREVIQKLREIAQGKTLPIAKDSILDFAVIGAAESAPTMALAASGLPGATLLWADYTVSAERELMQKGLSRDQAQTLAPTIGAVQSALDRVQLGFLQKMPGLGSILKKWSTSAAASFAGRVLGTTLAETGVELAQDQLAPAFVQEVGSWMDENIPGAKLGEAFKRAATAAPETFLSMLLLPILGAGRATWRDIQDARTVMNPDTLAAYGLTEEEIQTVGVAVAKGTKEGVAAFREVWQNRAVETGAFSRAPSMSEKGGSFGSRQRTLPVTTSPLPVEGQSTASATDVGGPGGSSVTENSSATTENSSADARAEVEQLNRDAGIREVRRGDDGWYLVTEDGQRIHAGTIEAANAIRHDLKRALTAKEANAYVAIADDIAASFQREGVKSEQILTGDIVQADGGQVSATRQDGTVESITFDAATARNLDAQLALSGATSGTIQGSNWIAEDASRMMKTNQTRDGVFTMLHEAAETRFRTIWTDEGRGAAIGAARTLVKTGLFDPARARTAEDKATAEALARVASGKASATEARETMVDLVVANELGKRKDGSRFTPGALTDGVEAAIRATTDTAERKTLGKFRAFLRAMKLYVRGVFATAAKLAKARRDGTLKPGDDFNSFADRLLGVDTQKEYNRGVYEEAKQYIPPTPEQEAAGMAFSVDGRAQVGRTGNRGRLLVFAQPIQTPAGQIVSYQWQSQLIEQTDARGEEVMRRISDWDMAVANAETGRSIVHHFTVERPDGSWSVLSMESALGALKGLPEAKTLKAQIAAARRLEVRKEQLRQAEQDLAEYERVLQDVKKEPVPVGEFNQIDSRRYGWSVDGGEIAVLVLTHDAAKERVRTLEEELQKDRDWKSRNWQDYRIRQRTNTAAYQLPGKIADLRQSIRRDNQKIGGKVEERVDPDSVSYNGPADGEAFSARATIKADENTRDIQASNGRVAGPATFSIQPDYGISHRPNDEGPRAHDLLEGDISPSDVYEHPEYYSAMEPKVIRETMAQLRKVRGNENAEVTIYRAGPAPEMNPGDWVSLSNEYARTHADAQDPEGYKVWSAKVKAKDVRWALDDLSEFGYFGEKVSAKDSGATFSIKAYHGTPHKVDKFTTEKIGTGEGAQAYGWGLYFAEEKAVAVEYRNQLAPASIWRRGQEEFDARDVTVESATSPNMGRAFLRQYKKVEDAIRDVEATKDTEFQGGAAERTSLLKQLNELRGFNREQGGRLYTVELLPDAEEFLDWDKPLSEQSDKVKAALGFTIRMSEDDEAAALSSGDPARIAEAERRMDNRIGSPANPDVLGSEYYSNQSNFLESFDAIGRSEYLASLGVPGIRYLDGNSRDGGSGTYNYVVFDEKLIKITEENGKPVSLADAGEAFSLSGAPSRVTPAQDAEYMAAVESGDMGTAQRLVDEAARAAGYNVGPVWHGTPNGWTVYDLQKSGTTDSGFLGKGIYLGPSQRWGEVYARGGKVLRLFASIKNPLQVEAEFNGRREIDRSITVKRVLGLLEDSPSIITKRALSLGYDGIQYSYKGEIETVVFDPNQIKSADPVTRDESGAVVPLSQRFDSSRNEITHSLSGGTALEAIAARLAKVPRTPDEKLALAEKLQEQIAGMGRAIAYNDSIADAVRAQDLQKEASKMRQAREAELLGQVESDFGDLSGTEFLSKALNDPLIDAIFIKGTGKFPKSQLMSRTRAEKYGRDSGGSYDGTDGIPSWMFGGNQAPDTMAQSLYEEGLLKEPSTDALWDGIRQSLKTAGAAKERLAKYAERKREARETARTEAATWLAEKTEKLPKLQADAKKAALIRAMTILDAILMAAPAEVRGKVGGFVALARLDTEKAREAFIMERIDKLESEFESYLKGKYSERLAKLIERGMPNAKPGEKARGAIGPEGHRFFSAVSEVVSMTSAQVEAKQAELEKELIRPREEGEAELTDTEAADIFEKQQVLDLFGNLKDKNSAELAKAYEAANSVYKKGRNRWRIIEEARLAEVRAVGDSVIEALGGAGYKAIQGSKANARGLKAKANSIRLELKNLSGFLKEILGESNEIAAKWTKAARDAMQFTETARRALKDEWKTKIEEATSKKGRAARLEVWGMVQNQTIDVVLAGAAKTSTRSVPESVLESIMDGTIDPRDVGLTRAQADALIGQEAGKPLEVKDTTRGPSENVKLSESEGIFITMLAAQEQYEKGLDAAGFTGDAIAAIEEALSPAAKALRSWMRGKYADNYNALNSVFSRMFGVDLAQIKNYAPAAFYHTGDANAKGPEDSTMQEGGFRSNFLKTRKKHRAAPRLENAFAAFFGHAAQSAHWQGFAELVREMRGVMARPDVKMAMEGRHGREVSGLMSDWLKNIEGNGISRAHGALDAFTGWLLRQAAYVHLAYNVVTLVVQSTAALGAAWKIGAGQYMRGLGKLMAGRLDVKAMWNSDLIQNRLANGYAPEVRAALNDLWSAKPSLRQDFLEKGMELIGFVDAFWTTGSAAIAYDAHYREAKAAGMPEESAKAIAMARTEETVGETAQPSTITEKSLFEAKQGNLAKLAFLYASESRQKTAMLANAWKKTFTGKATRQDVQVLILAHLIIGPALQFMRAALRDMKDDDDEEVFDKKHWQKPSDWLYAILLGPLNGIPLVGDLFSGYTSDNAAVGRFKEAGSSAISILKGPESGTAEKGEWYWNRVVRVLKGMDAATAVGAGIADQVFKTADNFSE